MYFHYFENIDYSNVPIVYLREGDIDWSFENPYIVPVEDIVAPKFDYNTEYLVDLMPERRADGTWVRRLEVRQFTPEELEARRELANKIPPDTVPKIISRLRQSL